LPFRRAILAYAEGAAGNGTPAVLNMPAARSLLSDLQTIEPTAHYAQCVFLLRWIGTTVGEDATKAALGVSPAGKLYDRMLKARDGAKAARAEYARRNSPEFIAEIRARKSTERAERHAARLAAKLIRDNERLKSGDDRGPEN
jgi:hypothetical protein